jgi:hypothetical protein
MKKIVKNFNNLVKKTIFKLLNKTNNNFEIVKNFNNLVKKTIFKLQNKTNNTLKISSFNKYLVTFIGVLFFYLFYLSIPVLYEKSWIQKNVESKLLEKFKINISTSSDISYRILPRPHFLIKDSKILIDDDINTKSIATVKDLKVFINQKNFLDKEKIILKKVVINKANFSLSKNDLNLLNKLSSNQFSNNRIIIENSNIFFKANSDESIVIVKIKKALLFFDDKKLLNLFNLKGDVFKIPFTFNLTKKIDSNEDTEININAKSLNLNIFNLYKKEKNNSIIGKNIISFLKSEIFTNYTVMDDTMIFQSKDSKAPNHNGELSINPFDLDLNIDLGNYKISKILNNNTILIEFIKTGLLFNNNLSLNTSITANTSDRGELFQSAKINLDINNGKVNFDKTSLVNDRIGSLELGNSNLFFDNEELVLNSDIKIDVKNSNNLYYFLKTNKNSRKEIKNIFINLNYYFLTNEIKFNSVKINDKEANDQLLSILESFDYNNFKNLNRSRRLLNSLFEVYEG